jgi:hypothetical protein
MRVISLLVVALAVLVAVEAARIDSIRRKGWKVAAVKPKVPVLGDQCKAPYRSEVGQCVEQAQCKPPATYISGGDVKCPVWLHLPPRPVLRVTF